MNPMEARKNPLQRYAATCGIVGPILHTLVVFVLGILTPGYSQATQLMSELGENGAPYALAMNLGGFLLLGVLLLIFSFGLHAALRPSRASRAGALLVVFAGLTYIGEALFSCDRGCVPVTFGGSAHLLIGEIAVFVAVLASYTLALAMRPDGRWNGYWQYSAATGILVILLIPLFPVFVCVTGVVQRLVVGVILLWLFVIALRAYRILGGNGT